MPENLTVDNADRSSDVDMDADDSSSEGNSDQVSECDVQSTASDDDNLCLYAGSNISPPQAILNVLKVYIAERWTKTSLDANVKLIKSFLPEPNCFPSSGKSLLSKLNVLSAFQVETEHFYCKDCHHIVKTESDRCPKKCKSQEIGVFF